MNCRNYGVLTAASWPGSHPSAGASEPRDLNFTEKFFHFSALNYQKSAAAVANKVLGKVIKMR